MINKKFNEEFNISFEPFMQKKECLVNATEMGSVFGKLVKDYLKTEKTQLFLSVLEGEWEIISAGRDFDEVNNPTARN